MKVAVLIGNDAGCVDGLDETIVSEGFTGDFIGEVADRAAIGAVLLSTTLVVLLIEFWCIIGGLLGFVGLGSVNGSQKTTPREALSSDFCLPDDCRMELCETPVEGALSMSRSC